MRGSTQENNFLIRSRMVQSRTTRDKALNTHKCKILQNSTYLIHYFRPLYIGNRLECWKAYNYIMINEITLMWLIIARKCYKFIGFDLWWLNQFSKLHTYACYFLDNFQRPLSSTLCSSTTQINFVSPFCFSSFI
jgi:hypothetical protein